MLNNFFRDELNLQKKMWHRALMVLYFSVFFIAMGICGFLTFEDQKYFRRVEPISNYFSSTNKTMNQITSNVNNNYYVGNENFFSTYGDTEFDVYKDNVFCSNNIYDDVDLYTKGGYKAENYMFQDGNGKRVPTSKENLVNLLKEKNIKCLSLDSYTTVSGDKFTFVEPYLNGQKYWFYEYSFLGTLGNFAINAFYIFLVALFILVFYYKVFIYIIYGK